MKEKILLVMPRGFNRGGVQNVVMNIVSHLSDQYTFDAIVYSSQPGYYDEFFSGFGGKIFRFHGLHELNVLSRKISIYFKYFVYRNRIKDIIKKNGPYKIIHCNNGLECFTEIKVAKECGIPCRIAHAHTVVQSMNWTRRLLCSYYRKQIRVLSTSMVGCSQLAVSSTFGNDSNCRIIRNSYNSAVFDPGKFQPPSFVHPVLIQIGNYSDLKNQLFSIKVLKQIKSVFQNAKMIFVGFDVNGYEKRLVEEIEKMGLNDNVSFYPSDSDTAKLLSESSCLLLPSKTESFGIVLLEAQAMGVKCYASDVIPEDANAGGVNYLPVATANAEEKWAEAIIKDFNQTHGAHSHYDCSSLTGDRIAQLFRNLYQGAN